MRVRWRRAIRLIKVEAGRDDPGSLGQSWKVSVKEPCGLCEATAPAALAFRKGRNYVRPLVRPCAGETGVNPGAEGATAPETLRQKDRARSANSGEQGHYAAHRRSKLAVSE